MKHSPKYPCQGVKSGSADWGGAVSGWALLCVLLFVSAGCQSQQVAGSEPSNTDISDKISNNLRAISRAQSAEEMLGLARERGYAVDGDAMLVDVQTRGLESKDEAKFDLEGVRVESFSTKYQRVGAGVLTPAALRRLAAIDVVRRIEPNYGRTSND